MWEEGICIYGTPGVPNNFPIFYGTTVVIYNANLNIIDGFGSCMNEIFYNVYNCFVYIFIYLIFKKEVFQTSLSL